MEECPIGRAHTTFHVCVPALEMQKQLPGDLSCKAKVQNWKGWLNSPLAPD